MDWTLLYLLPLVVAIVLTIVAFRAHERYWSLGFLGWRRVYLGLGAYMGAGIVSGIIYWVKIVSPGSGAVPWLQAGLVLFSAIGIVLILYGSIERLRELSAEHAHLEDVRAGFDLFDTLREVIGQPYAFLEILDYALKEMVRAADVDSGGLWLYNQSKSEWILTGWANLSEKLRQQTESIKGSGSGFDRLAGAHKARLFVGAEKLRVSFPEWEAEGFQSILGLPLVSGTVGSGGRQVLGAIVLADRSAHRFDDDRARRLYAASDYVAAVIAEARIVRQLDSSRSQLDAAYAELEREREEARKQKQDAEHQLLALKQQAEDDQAALESHHQSQLTETRQAAEATLKSTRDELTAKHEQTLTTVRADYQTQIGVLQKRHDDELGRLRQEAASMREGLETQLAQARQLHQDELQSVRSEYESMFDDTETVHAEELRLAKVETDKVRAEMEARLGESRTQAERLKQSLSELESRTANERQVWENRLDELHKTDQAERAKERQRHDAVAAKMREELAAAQKRYDVETKKLRDDLTAAQQRHEAKEARLREELAAAQQRHEATAAGLRDELAGAQQRHEAEEIALRDELASTQQRHDAEEAKLRDDIVSAQQRHDDAVARLREEMVAAQQRHDAHEAKLQSEFASTQQRHDAAVAELRDELTAAQHRHTELQAALEGVKTLATERETALRTAEATLKEREETLKTERRAREELVGSHKDTLAILQSRIDATSEELTALEERAEILQRDLNHVQESAAARETELASERDQLASEILAVKGELDSERANAESFKERMEREHQSVKLMLVEREKQLSSWRDAHREACAESRALEEQVAGLQAEMTSIANDIRDTLAAEAERRNELEDELEVLHHERTELEERRQRELVEERLEHRRKLHKIEFEMASLRERMQRALAVPEPRGRIETLVRCIAERIPSAHVYVWRRQPDGSARMLGWMNDERELIEGPSLPPWSFELDTIPAEGINELTDASNLASLINNHAQAHLDSWLAHWGPNTQPDWCMCWPWQGVSSSMLGWVTVFGFDAQPPVAETVDEVDTWVGLIGAVIESIGESFAEQPESDATEYESDGASETDDPEETVETSDQADVIVETDESDESVAEESQSGDDEPAGDESVSMQVLSPERRWIDLHNVILNWAAHQTEDALRLDLTAQPAITVDEGWVCETLDHGRQSCRVEGASGEFLVSTHRQNGHTVLRLVRGGEGSEPEDDNVAAVEDSELVTESTDADASSASADHDTPVSGRWLVRDGNRVGMELRFSHTTDVSADAENQQVSGRLRTVLVTDDDDAMVELLTGMIDSLGADTLTAANRDQAQDQLRQNDVDLVVINAGMGGGTGWNIARWFKDANPQLPVVLVVGAETMSIPDDFPGDWMLRLPFQIDELRECLESLTSVKA